MNSIFGYHWMDLIQIVEIQLKILTERVRNAIKVSEVHGYPSGFV